jgi:hypothetical protein
MQRNEDFAAFWPNQPEDNPFTPVLNNRQKLSLRRLAHHPTRDDKVRERSPSVLLGQEVVAVSEPIVSVDVSDVPEGKLEELKTLMKELVEFVEATEPRPIAYQMFLDQAGTKMTVIQVHPDSESMELHMEVAASLFPRFSDLLTLLRIDIYGEPSDELVRRMRQKGRLLGDAPVVEHRLHAGFTRFAPPGRTPGRAP